MPYVKRINIEIIKIKQSFNLSHCILPASFADDKVATIAITSYLTKKLSNLATFLCSIRC